MHVELEIIRLTESFDLSDAFSSNLQVLCIEDVSKVVLIWHGPGV